MVLMGRLSHYFPNIPAEAWQASLEANVPAKVLELNKVAFALGQKAEKTHPTHSRREPKTGSRRILLPVFAPSTIFPSKSPEDSSISALDSGKKHGRIENNQAMIT